jgi:transposase-like protein
VRDHEAVHGTSRDLNWPPSATVMVNGMGTETSLTVFTPAFKGEVVALNRQGDRTVRAIRREMDLSETAVRRWVEQAAVDAGGKAGLTTEERHVADGRSGGSDQEPRLARSKSDAQRQGICGGTRGRTREDPGAHRVESAVAVHGRQHPIDQVRGARATCRNSSRWSRTTACSTPVAASRGR